MIQKLGIEESEVSEFNRVLYKNYGTSMAGLKVYSICNLIYSLVHLHIYACMCVWADVNAVIFVNLQAVGYDFDNDNYHR